MTEGRLLLDTCHDQPELHIGFKANGEVQERNRSATGARSIRVFNLTRKRPRDARRSHTDTIHELIDESVANGSDRAASTTAVLTVLARANRQYAGLARGACRQGGVQVLSSAVTRPIVMGM